MLGGLFIASTVSAVRAALASAGTAATATVIVVGDAKLGKALRAEGVAATVVSAKPPRGMTDAITGTPASIPVPDGSAAALVGVSASGASDHAALAEWCRIVRDGGAVILVDRGAPEAATRAALCAGLTEIEQRAAGRITVTSGLVTTLA